MEELAKVTQARSPVIVPVDTLGIFVRLLPTHVTQAHVRMKEFAKVLAKELPLSPVGAKVRDSLETYVTNRLLPTHAILALV